MSDNPNMATKLVANRGNRAAAIILGWMERNIYQYLPDEEQSRTREIVLDQINEFKDLVIDVVKSDTGYVNDFWLEKLDEIHREIRANGRLASRS